MSRYEAAPYLQDLTDFQHRSVEHVFRQFYGPAQATRFLVADETGLGKTRVARGLIARAIEHLQDETSVDRIDVVYVCANADLAMQNIRRLNVTEQDEIPFSSRLTLLAEHSRRLNRRHGKEKPVNLVSFTPGTSFDMGHGLGKARERAMILIALNELFELDGWEKTAVHLLLQGQVRSLQGFRDTVKWLQHDIGDRGIDPAIRGEFRRIIAKGGRNSLKARFLELVSEMGHKQSIPERLHLPSRNLVHDLRGALAAASVHTLEPDLVILDEFQRFRHLLDPTNPAGELAHHLFEYGAAKVLLLSATPYKPFTYVEEREEDHARDLFRTLGFLAKGRRDVDVDDIRAQLKKYRDVVVTGSHDPMVIADLREMLLRLMSRAERPVLPEGSMTTELRRTAGDVRATDLAGYARLRTVSRLVARERDHGLVTSEYWKSAPYFINFCDGYQLGRRLGEAVSSPDLVAALAATQRIAADDLTKFQSLEPGNARMRMLAADTVGQGWWQLLWVPPSLPYLIPEGPYASPAAQGMTKRLVFSSWSATPTAVASILSFEAERCAAAGSNYSRYTPENRRKLTKPLQYSLRYGKPARMSTLLLHWPMPIFARAVDPLASIAASGGSPLSTEDARALALPVIANLLADAHRVSAETTLDADGSSDARESHWRAAFAIAGNWPTDDAETDAQELAWALAGVHRENTDDESEPEDMAGLARHIEEARTAIAAGPGDIDGGTLHQVTDVALFSPANISFRVLARFVFAGDESSSRGLFEAAATLANGLRSLFNRPDVTKLVEAIAGEESEPYWRKVLAYCAMGNLEAVLDEYLHHLVADKSTGVMNDDLLHEVAEEAANALSLRSAPLQAKDPVDPDRDISFVPRFALRYGARQQAAEDARQPEVRRSFNSPFWPMVLASTSVGQEGIDFHWWCHVIFHWNTPANPVDFEQRAGRIDRYRGHAVRRNIAAKHGAAALAVHDGNPWDRLYKLATDFQDEYGQFTPGWVYPGPAKIERHLAPFVLSSDDGKYDRMKQDVALYRLTFGQPRQEDMLELLRKRGIDIDPKLLKALRIDLSP